MTRVAKVLIIDDTDRYLIMERANHPIFLNDPDLPGGMIEEGEEPLEAAIREVVEEANIMLSPTDIELLYAGDTYSAHGTHYSLYLARILERPPVTISWEHASFAWVDRKDFLEQARNANDTYMHMVHDIVSRN